MNDYMGRYFAPCKICIPLIPVGYAGGRAMQEQLRGHEGHEEIKLRVFVMNNTAKIYFKILANIAS